MVRERLLWVDIVRTLAIFLIVLFHFIYEINPDQSLRWIGYVGVSLFFIASGYVLAKNYPDLENLNLSWLKKRYDRIVSL
ncbi:MAG: acyltransferase family protein [Candidatus Bilamarchaeaceae archaeon]